MSEEIWKPIEGYDYYEVSNKGRVRSLDREISFSTYKYDTDYVKKGRILKPVISTSGYYTVSLIGNDKSRKVCRIHRLVAQAFIPNPNNYPIINHKNEIRTDNRVENLEWCTPMYNNHYSNVGKKVGEKLKNNEVLSKPVIQYDLKGNFIAEYPSIKEAERQTGIQDISIGNCCRGYIITKVTQAGGFKWKYKKN